MTINSTGKASRGAFMGLVKELADRLQLDSSQRAALMSLFRSVAFLEDVQTSIDDHEAEYHA